MSPTSPDRIVLTDLHRQELTGLIRAGRTEQSDHPTLARLGHRLRRSSLTGNANQAADGSRALMGLRLNPRACRHIALCIGEPRRDTLGKTTEVSIVFSV